MAGNPFIWGQTIDDGIKRNQFCTEIAIDLKGQMNKSMFGIRGTGKSSFLQYELAEELHKKEPGMPKWDMLYVDLGKVINNSSFVTALVSAMKKVKSDSLRRRAVIRLSELELSFNVNFGVGEIGVKKVPDAPANLDNPELLRETLSSIRELCPHLVVAFDEFQALYEYPENPLPMIRSTLLSGGEGEIALLISGSIKRKIQMMKKKNMDALWDDLDDVSFPNLSADKLISHIEDKFNNSGREITPQGAEYIVQISAGHPKTTQRISSYIWKSAQGIKLIDKTYVSQAYIEHMTDTEALQDYVMLMNGLKEGSKAEQAEWKALYMIASGGLTSNDVDYRKYGFNSRQTSQQAADRLENKGLIYNTSRVSKRYQVQDPLFAAYLRSTNPVII